MAMEYLPMKQRTKIQDLYDRCNLVFSGYQGITPTIEEIQWLQDILAKTESIDVGIDGSGDDDGLVKPLIRGSKLERITYVHIHECDRFSMGVFCFPAGAQLPLHDHPEMVVLSRVLYGSVLTRAYDWVMPPDPRYKNCGLARIVIDDQVLDSASPPSVLFPTSGGNLHTFTALTPCAILDVLSPPYSEEKGRPSTYYTEISIPCFEGFAVLKETSVPDDLFVDGALYLGPELVLDDEEDDDDDDDDVGMEEEDDNVDGDD
ncbi:Cysteamine dioxygenase [Zostera marina]|uniref:cysteine dioxygenase n=1 Tax=Zostera marina TaxID=29655 RepID=A0A0K9PEF3_ZOSMR|nr:Cysteamine dioxygenase [Zostera marina]